jgi:hypothetical protein
MPNFVIKLVRMHDIEPFYSWRHLYIAEEDHRSPFYGREYSEFEFIHAIYDHFIHPQWDEMGSATLYLKVLFVNYESGFCIIELLGEWNDTLYNDIMYLKRNVAEKMIDNGISKFILIGENVLNFHSADNDYYQEWFDDIEDGWIVGLNFRNHVIREFNNANLDYYIAFGGKFDHFNWRGYDPNQLFQAIESQMIKRLNP